MSNQKEEHHLEHTDSVVETSDSTSGSSTSDSKSIETESEFVGTSIVEKKVPFLEPLKTNRFFLIRVLYYLLRSIWIVVMIIGGILAWIISMLFI